jgi:hypothetical protein
MTGLVGIRSGATAASGRARRPPLAFIAALGLLVLLAFSPASAGAAGIVNGGFETGTLAGWQVANGNENGDIWSAATPTEPTEGIFKPFEGGSEALLDPSTASAALLYQEVSLEPGESDVLSLELSYESQAPFEVPVPDTLAFLGTDEEGGEPQANQQVRVDVLKAGSPVYSLAPEDLLATLLEPEPGAPQTIGWTHLTADLTPFAGETVRIRIADIAAHRYLGVAVDDVSVTSTPPPAAPLMPLAPIAPVVSAGPTSLVTPQCTVPNLKGKTLKAAKQRIRAADCKVGKVKRHRGAEARGTRVVGQRPRPGTILPAGSIVRVTVGKA